MAPTKCHFLSFSNTCDQRHCGYRPPGLCSWQCLCFPWGPPPCFQARPAMGPSSQLSALRDLFSPDSTPSLAVASLRGAHNSGAAVLIPQLSLSSAVVPKLQGVDSWVSLLSIIKPSPGTWKELLILTVITIIDFY